MTALRRRSRFTVVASQCFETLSYSAIESMACGRAVVASRLGGLAEIIDDGTTGILVPEGDPVALASAIEALWDDRERAARMGLSAWRQAREQFSPLVQARRLAELYERVLASRPAPVA